MVISIVLITPMNLYQSALIVLRIPLSSPANTVVRWCVSAKIIISVLVVVGGTAIYVMMVVIKILLLATTAACQAIMVTVPCAGMAARVFIPTPVVIMFLIVVMALINLTHFLSVTFAQRRGVCPAQVFLGTVESFVTAVPPVQISGTNYSPPANPIQRGTNQMPFAVRRPASTSVEMDQCV